MGAKPLVKGSCAVCKTSYSPEWRKGLNGERNLCNACGIKLRKMKDEEKALGSDYVPSQHGSLNAILN